jgi:outer membrane lipoprotein-sorting protein
MKQLVFRLAFLFFVPFAAVTLAQGGSDKEVSWTAKSALKEMDKALKGVTGLTAQVHWDELVCDQKMVGSGNFYVNVAGQVRAEVGSSTPRTIIVTPPFFYIYKPIEGIAERYYLPSRPDLMGQYALLGFSPAGSDLKKEYKVTFLRSEELDGRQTVVFNLVPKSKEAAATIAAIVLWVDQATWMPYQQIIRHASSGLQATIRYSDITPDNDLSEDVFKKVWPAETKIVPQ